MKKNGFTLVELLAVIIMLSLLMLIVLPRMFDSVKNHSKNTDEAIKETIYKASEIYISNHDDKFPKVNGYKFIINLKDLVDEKILASQLKLFNVDNIVRTMCVQVEYNDGFSYELRDIGACERTIVCESKTGTEVYYPGQEYICEVKPGTKHNFYVLSTEEDENGNVKSVSFLMKYFIAKNGTEITSNSDVESLKEQKIEFATAWITTDQYSGVDCREVAKAAGQKEENWDRYCATWYARSDKGPIEALTYLEAATKDWVNIPNIEINYSDEGHNYGGLITEGNKTLLKDKLGNTTRIFYNLKARLPKYSEINDQLVIGFAQLPWNELSDLEISRDVGFIEYLPLWITEYIPRYKEESRAWEKYDTWEECISSTKPENWRSANDPPICHLSGFWLLASDTDGTRSFAYDVSSEGYLGKSTVVASPYIYKQMFTGIRPVITLPKTVLP